MTARRTRRLAWALPGLALATALVVVPQHAAAAPARELGGMGLSAPSSPPANTVPDLPRVRALGLTVGVIDIFWDVNNASSNSMQPGSRTLSDAELRRYIADVRGAGFQVYLVPKLTCRDCATDRKWRGFYTPSDIGTWFANYRAFVNRYADIARETGVTSFFFGSEYSSLQKESAEWRRVAAEARQHFGGPVIYNATWNTLNVIDWWDESAVISVSAYYPLSDEPSPTLSTLRTAWHDSQAEKTIHRNWFGELKQLSTTFGRKVLFGEAGYASTTYGAKQPYTLTEQHEPDPELQGRLYQALLETFSGEAWWVGVIWWEWTKHNAGPDRIGYTPRDRPAETVLRNWYSPSAPPPTRPPSARPSTPPSSRPTGARPGGPTTGSGPAATVGVVPAASPAARPAASAAASAAPSGVPTSSSDDDATAVAPGTSDSGGGRGGTLLIGVRGDGTARGIPAVAASALVAGMLGAVGVSAWRRRRIRQGWVVAWTRE